jgi:hypothetical protein
MADDMSLIFSGAALLLLGAFSCTKAQPDARRAETAAVATQSSAPAPSPELSAEDRKRFQDAASLAWKYLNDNYQSSTGLVNATADWPNTTLWDIGGQLLAFHSAKGLGLLSQADFDSRVKTVLGTLEKAPLFHNVAYQKIYSTRTGGIGEGGGKGFAATDLGRFLVAMKVLSVTEPQHAAQIARIVKRIDFKPIVSDGYMHGQLIGSNGKPFTFQEGRIGYEQYTARGFKEWGADVSNALDLSKNAAPVKVYGVPLLGDKRFQDRLLSEPFILYGLELGMPDDVKQLAENVLRAQQARFDSTGKMTIVSEDASSVPPQYFYYYCVYCNGKPYVIDIAMPGNEQDGPRWVSTKAAFGWYALMPGDYTRKAVGYVASAADPKRGWASGVGEVNGKPTNAFDINTASVILEAAYYALRGSKPLIDPTGAAR